MGLPPRFLTNIHTETNTPITYKNIHTVNFHHAQLFLTYPQLQTKETHLPPPPSSWPPVCETPWCSPASPLGPHSYKIQFTFIQFSLKPILTQKLSHTSIHRRIHFTPIYPTLIHQTQPIRFSLGFNRADCMLQDCRS